MGIVTSRRHSLTPRLIRVKAKDEDSVQPNKYQLLLADPEANKTVLPTRATPRVKSAPEVGGGTTDVLPNKEFRVDFFYFHEERVSLTSLDKCLVSESQRPKQMHWIVKPVKADDGLLPTFSVIRYITVNRSYHRVVEKKKASTVSVTQDNRGGIRRAKMVVTFEDDDEQKGTVTSKLVLQGDAAREDAEQGWILNGKMYQDSGRSWTAFIAKAKLTKQKAKETESVSLSNTITEGEHSPTRDSAK